MRHPVQITKENNLVFYQAYNISIKDPEQPMLVSKPKEKDRRGGRTQLLYLVPELCFMTGELRS